MAEDLEAQLAHEFGTHTHHNLHPPLEEVRLSPEILQFLQDIAEEVCLVMSIHHSTEVQGIARRAYHATGPRTTFRYRFSTSNPLFHIASWFYSGWSVVVKCPFYRSSHNTYLLSRQIIGTASPASYIHVLRRDGRCVGKSTFGMVYYSLDWHIFIYRNRRLALVQRLDRYSWIYS